MNEELSELTQKYVNQLILANQQRSSAMADSRPDDVHVLNGVASTLGVVIHDLREIIGNESRCGV